MIDPSPPMDLIGKVLKKAKQAAINYHRLTGKPLGIIGSARCPNARPRIRHEIGHRPTAASSTKSRY